ncbi:MAG: methionine biosynthesis protein MetW [Dehalococcoidales bacterium]|nr:methionine biosynthesis protein MetW [Dehalococcoidales bacterium]
MNKKTDPTALQHKVIMELIPPGAAVLDLGCGNGELMAKLAREKAASVRGIEVNETEIYKCVARGLSVFHDDIDSGLSEYGDKSFDYVILNHSFQQVKKPEAVLGEALRVGKKVIVGFPNFAHYSVRWQMGIRGRTPVTPSLPYEWYNTPNIHFLTISDFVRFCRRRGIRIEKSCIIGKSGRVKLFGNLFGASGIFLISNGHTSKMGNNTLV